MKALKIAAIALGSLVALAAILAGLALTPAVQTWAVRRAVAGRPGLSLQLGRVAAGPSAVDLADVRCETGGMAVAVRSVHVAYSAWDYLRGRRIEVADLEVHGIEADLSHPAPAAAPARSAPSASGNPLEALFAPARLPVDFQLGKLAADGSVRLPGGRSATFSLGGGGFGTGRSGQVDWKADFRDESPSAPVASAHSEGSLSATVAADRLLTRFELEAEAGATGPGVPADRLRVRLQADEASEAAGKTVTAAVSVVHGGRASPLLSLDTRWPPGALLSGHWSLTVAPEQAATWLAAFGLPRTDLAGAGDFTVKPDTGDLAADGKLSAGLSELQRLSPALSGVGSVRIEAQFGGGFAGGRASLDRLRFQALDAAGRAFIDVEALQRVSYDPEAGRVIFADPKADLARVSVKGLPLAWAQPALKGAAVKGGELSLGFAVGADPDGSRVSLRTTDPIAVRGLALQPAGAPALDGIDLDALLQGQWRGNRIAWSMPSLEVRRKAASLLRGTAGGEAALGGPLKASASGKIDADLAALTQLPGVPARLSRGRLSAQFQGSVGSGLQLDASLSALGLVAEQGNTALGDLALKATATLNDDGTGQIDVPLTLKVADRSSDLSVKGSISRTPALLSFDGRVASRQLYAQDFQPLAALAPGGSGPGGAAPAGTAAPIAPAKDTQPFWKGFAGRIGLDLKSVQVGPDYAASDIAGSLSADNRQVAVDSLQGRFKGNAFKASARVSFDGSKDKPYALAADVDVPGFDVGAFLKAADPADPPAMETQVTIAAKVQGDGLNPADLAQRAYGQCDVSGTQGVLRALGKQGKIASAASSLLGLFGAVQGSDTTTAVAEIAGQLNEMKFDKFQAHVERGADLNVKLTSLEFLAPDKHLTGTGTITYQAGVPLADQPLHVDLLLAAKSPLAVPLNRLGLLGSDQDDQGYAKMASPFAITGTLAKPDSSQLWQILGKAAAGAALNGLGRFLQR